MTVCRLLKSAFYTLVGWIALSHGALAQAFPDRPITFVLPSSAGGPAEHSGRLISDRMAQALGQQIIIEPNPGAGGTIALARVARSAPDGYTLLLHQNGFAITPAIYEKLPFDIEKDFVTVGLINQSFSVLVGRKDLPANTFAELVAWMKGPGKPAKYGHPGPGSTGHLQSTMLVRALGVDASLVAYRGIAPAVNDLLGGHIDIANVGAAVATEQVKSGTLKPFAMGASMRSPVLPDVPTFGELGFREQERPFWHALFAPAATPRPILDKLNAALREALADTTVKKHFTESGLELFPASQQSLDGAGDYVKSEIRFWGKVVRDNNVKVSNN